MPDEVAVILFFVAVIILGPWLFVALMGRRRRRERLENEERIASLTHRLYSLEQKVKELAQRGIAPAPAAEPAAAARPEPKPAAPPPAPVPPPAPPQPQWYGTVKPAPAPAPAPPKPVAPPATQPTAATAAQASASVMAPTMAPRVAPPPTPPPPPAPPKKPFSIEDTLGRNWLAKLGIGLLVLGIAYGLSLFWNAIGPWGRVGIGYLAGGALLGGGIWLEHKEQYRAFARTGIGGGWAVLFFVTYALHHIPATAVIASQAVDLVLLLIVAGVMVAHTLRYNSQVVTGIAFLLAFSTVTISRENVYSLGASAILAIALVIIVVRRQWFELEVFGILASYLNHWWWLRGIIEPMGGQKHMYAEFYPSAAILILYWAAYRGSYVVRKIETEFQERVSSVAAILNTFLLLAVLKYQSVTPKYAFYALLVLGVAEMALGLLMRARERRDAFVILATIGALLFTAAWPFKFSPEGGQLSIIWLLVAEAFYLAGVFDDELLFRRFGRLAELTAAIQLYYSHPLDGAKSWRSAIVFWLAAVMFGANSHIVPWRWPKIFETQWEKFGVKLVSWMGVAMAMTAIWLSVPERWNAVGWATLAFWLGFAAFTLKQEELAYQANVVGISATICALVVNLDDHVVWHGVAMPVITVSLVAALLYATARLTVTPKLLESSGISLRPVYTWAAALLIGLLAWNEVAAPWIGCVWILFGLLLSYLGRRKELRDLGMQGNLLAFAAAVYAIAISTGYADTWHLGMSLRLASTAVVIAALYVQAQWAELPGLAIGLGMLHAWAASFLVGWLMWYELQPVGVAVAWVLFGVGLLELGLALPKSDKHWRMQAYIELAAAFARIFFVNLNAAGEMGEVSPRVYTTVPIALLFFYAYARMVTASDLEEKSGTRRFSTLLAWMGTITVVSLVRFELALDWVVSGWAVLVAVLLAVAWRTGKRTFTAQAVLLTIAIAFRTVMHNFYQRSYFAAETWAQRWLPVGLTVILLFAALAPAFRIRQLTVADGERARNPFGAILRRPEQLLFFVAVALLTVLLYLQVKHGLVTVAWGVEAVMVFVFALLVKERSFRLTGLAILMLGIGKIFVIDFWNFETWQKAVTFVVVGLVALGMSLLYTRYKEALKEYL